MRCIIEIISQFFQNFHNPKLTMTVVVIVHIIRNAWEYIVCFTNINPFYLGEGRIWPRAVAMSVTNPAGEASL